MLKAWQNVFGFKSWEQSLAEMIGESAVHAALREFLRQGQGQPWSHQLTMARMVARALRVGRSALIQTGCGSDRYCVSYLMPMLIEPGPVLLVFPEELHSSHLETHLSHLQDWLPSSKSIQRGDRWPGEFSGLMLTTPQAWLSDRLAQGDRFPGGIPTVIDHADNLERWTQELLTQHIDGRDWEQLMQGYPAQQEQIRRVRRQLTQSLFSHPPNPYGCYLLEPQEKEWLQSLWQTLAITATPSSSGIATSLKELNWRSREMMFWAALSRETLSFTLHYAPIEVGSLLEPIWQQQALVLVGHFLDQQQNAAIFRERLGLGELLCLRFSPNRHQDCIQLYLPERLPLPNTPQFQGELARQSLALIYLCESVKELLVLLIEDVPLKAQIASYLAAEFGSRVQVETCALPQNGVLICGWGFWRTHQDQLPTPQLLAIATLPFPSLEHPLVAARVAYHKQKRQDWFRRYLLPTALQSIQQAVIPLRESQGIVAVFDNRINHRSYGSQILEVLEPYARINYLDRNWLPTS